MLIYWRFKIWADYEKVGKARLGRRSRCVLLFLDGECCPGPLLFLSLILAFKGCPSPLHYALSAISLSSHIATALELRDHGILALRPLRPQAEVKSPTVSIVYLRYLPRQWKPNTISSTPHPLSLCILSPFLCQVSKVRSSHPVSPCLSGFSLYFS